MDRINKLKEFLEASPDDPFLLHALALEYIKIKNDAEAKKLFGRILSRYPDYVGSYYHLGKLLERQQETQAAIAVYESGMLAARRMKDPHAYNELQGAYEDLIDL